MKKVLASTLGVILATSAVTAFAGKEDRENLAQCKADVDAYYGERTRVRLRSIKRLDTETQMRLMVTPGSGGSNQVVVCSVGLDGLTSLADRDGVALAPMGGQDAVSLAR